MSVKGKRFQKSIITKPTTSPATEEGEIRNDSSDNKQKVYTEGAEREILTADQTQTLENKTIDSSTNTITIDADESTVENLEVDNLKAGVLETDLNNVVDDTNLASAQAVKTYVSEQVATKDEASEISYDNTASGLVGDNVQTAVDEVEGRLDTAETDISTVTTGLSDHLADTEDAHDASAISSIPTGNLAADNVQGALDELQTDIDSRALASDLTDHINDVAGAHASSAISYDNATSTLTAINAQDAIDEVEGRLDTAEAAISTNSSDLTNHLSDATDAHDASAISVVPTGNLAADDVQEALEELQTDVDTRATDADLTTHTGATSGVHGVTGDVVGTTDTQILTNKTLDGATINTPEKNQAKIDTRANLEVYATTADNGEMVYASDTNEFFTITDAELVAVGGAGVSDKSVYAQFDAEDQDVDNFTNISVSGTGAINQDNSYIVDSFPASLPSVSLNSRNKNKENNIELHYTLISGTAKAVVKDQTLSVLQEIELEQTNNPQKVVLNFIVTGAMSDLTLEFEDVSSATSLKIDDIIFSDDSFRTAQLEDVQSGRYSFGQNASTNTRIRYFDNELELEGTELVTVDNSSTLGFSLTANVDCTINVQYSDLNSSTVQFGISKNSGSLSTDITSLPTADIALISSVGTASSGESLSGTLRLKKGDVLRPHVRLAGWQTADYATTFTFVAKKLSEHIITPAKSNLTDWTAYTPTTQGFGTITNEEAFWRRVGDTMELQVRFQCGTVSAVEGRIGLPNGEIIDFDKVGNTQAVGYFVRQLANNTVPEYLPLAGGNNNYLNFGRRDNVQQPLSFALGGNMADTNGVISFFARVPIQGWSSNVNFLAAIPVQRTAYIEDIKPLGTQGGNATGSWTTRDLNTISGDEIGLTVSSNQFTLPAGEYTIEGEAPAIDTNATKIRIQDITNATTIKEGPNQNSQNGSTVSVLCKVKTNIKLDVSTTFELQHIAQTTSNTFGFGAAGNLGSNETYAQVKITKIK